MFHQPNENQHIICHFLTFILLLLVHRPCFCVQKTLFLKFSYQNSLQCDKKLLIQKNQKTTLSLATKLYNLDCCNVIDKASFTQNFFLLFSTIFVLKTGNLLDSYHLKSSTKKIFQHDHHQLLKGMTHQGLMLIYNFLIEF